MGRQRGARGLVVLIAVVAVAVGAWIIVEFPRDDTVSKSEFLNSKRDLDTYLDPYLQHVAEHAESEDVLPADVGTDLAPLRKDFATGTKEWSQRYDVWELPEEGGTGVPTKVAVIAFDNALQDLESVTEDLGRALGECAGRSTFEACVAADRSAVGDRWEEALALIEETEQQMAMSAELSAGSKR